MEYPLTISDYFDWLEEFKIRHGATASEIVNKKADSTPAGRAEAWGIFLANTRSGFSDEDFVTERERRGIPSSAPLADV